MINFLMDIPQLLDVEVLPLSSITLSTDVITQAVQLSQPIVHEARQWQTYLNALALFGFEQWLKERTPELSCNREQSSVFHPTVANAIASVCHLEVNGFKLCLLATDTLIDEEITVPRAVVDIPEFVPHFYVLVDVREEQEIVRVFGLLSYQQLMERRATVELQADEDWTYQLPLTWFESDPDSLLLYLRGLNPAAIPLPTVPSTRLTTLSTMQQELAAVLPQLQAPECHLWQVLTWEQGVAVLTNPELLNWVYQVQNCQIGEEEPKLNKSLSDLLHLLTQPAINVGRWLWNELDELAQSFSWVLLPNLAPTALRSPVEEFEAIASRLEHKGLNIPPHARGAYRELGLAGIPLRLYALAWPLVDESESQGWTLLMMLGTPSGSTLPCSLQLRVSDQTGVLVEQMPTPGSDDTYLFTRVIGDWDEKFVVSVRLTNGLELTLPPFAFNW